MKKFRYVDENKIADDAHSFAIRAYIVFQRFGWTYYFTDAPTVSQIEEFANKGAQAVLADFPKNKEHTWSCGRVVVNRYKNEISFSLDVEAHGEAVEKPINLDTVLSEESGWAEEVTDWEPLWPVPDTCAPDCKWCAIAREYAKEYACTKEESVLDSESNKTEVGIF